MNCASCGTQVPSAFGYALRKNECPACGKAIMDEESMAIVEELRDFILQTVKVREETADALAMALMVSYSISRHTDQPLSKRSVRQPKNGTIVQRSDEDGEAGDGGIVRASDLFDPDSPISQAEKEEILKERIETRLIAQNMIPSQVATRVKTSSNAQLSDSQMAESQILEADRLLRLQRQESNRLNNPSSQCSVVTRRDQ